jgi:hypothetical protein
MKVKKMMIHLIFLGDLFPINNDHHHHHQQQQPIAAAVDNHNSIQKQGATVTNLYMPSDNDGFDVAFPSVSAPGVSSSSSSSTFLSSALISPVIQSSSSASVHPPPAPFAAGKTQLPIASPVEAAAASSTRNGIENPSKSVVLPPGVVRPPAPVATTVAYTPGPSPASSSSFFPPASAKPVGVVPSALFGGGQNHGVDDDGSVSGDASNRSSSFFFKNDKNNHNHQQPSASASSSKRPSFAVQPPQQMTRAGDDDGAVHDESRFFSNSGVFAASSARSSSSLASAVAHPSPSVVAPVSSSKLTASLPVTRAAPSSSSASGAPLQIPVFKPPSAVVQPPSFQQQPSPSAQENSMPASQPAAAVVPKSFVIASLSPFTSKVSAAAAVGPLRAAAKAAAGNRLMPKPVNAASNPFGP